MGAIAQNLPPLASLLVGSYALPTWYQGALDHIRRGEYGELDVKAFQRETPDDVAEAARRVLRYVPADRLYLTADCGFFATPRWIAQRKMNALAEGARRVRKELSHA